MTASSQTVFVEQRFTPLVAAAAWIHGRDVVIHVLVVAF